MLTLRAAEAVQGAFRLTADLTVEAGARVSVIGASGSGKSTLLNIVAGFLPVSSGTVEIDGQDVREVAPGDRPVSIVFQDSNLFPHLTVAQNVGLGIKPGLRLDAAETQAIEEALARVGLEGYGARKPAALSGGQQSRVALARVLLRRRPLLLLDEPFAALGPALRAEMLELVGEIADQQNLTVMMVTHEPTDARALTPLSIFVDEGVAQPPVATDQLLDNPPQALRDYLGS